MFLRVYYTYIEREFLFSFIFPKMISDETYIAVTNI